MNISYISCQDLSVFSHEGSLLVFTIKSDTTDKDWHNIVQLLPSFKYTDSDESHHALSKAACQGNLDLIDTIYSWAGPKIIDLGNPNGETALNCIFKCSPHNLLLVAKKLIELGANVNIMGVKQDAMYHTPLWRAAGDKFEDHPDGRTLLKMLLIRGAVIYPGLAYGVCSEVKNRLARIESAKNELKQLFQIHIMLQLAKAESVKDDLSDHSIGILPVEIIDLISYINICVTRNGI